MTYYNTPPGLLDYSGNFEQKWKENERRIEEGLCQPGLWCKWYITDDGQYLEWNGAEKFYYYIEWLEYYIQHFFKKWGVKLNGRIDWQGEEENDHGIIFVRNNKVKILSTEKEMLQFERKQKLDKLNEI